MACDSEVRQEEIGFDYLTATFGMKKRFLILLVLFLLMWGCEEIFRRKIGGFAGSYPFAETWSIQGSERDILAAVHEIRKDYPLFARQDEKDLEVDDDAKYDWNSIEMQAFNKKYLADSLTPLPPKTALNTLSTEEYWRFIDFYYADTDEVVHAWTRDGASDTVTTLALVSVDDRLINRDYWYVANVLAIRKFKRGVVDRIQQEIDRKKAAGKKSSSL